jgi:cell division protein FtsB
VKLYIDQYIEIRRLGREVEVARTHFEETQREHEKLAEEVEYLETLEGVERLARDKLRYIRPDEVILVPLRPDSG